MQVRVTMRAMSSVVAALDSDEDGTTDILALDDAGRALWVMAPAALEGWRCAPERATPLPEEGLTQLFATDWDGDGDGDLLAFAGAAGARLWRRGSPTVQVALPSSAVQAAVGDLDGDGRPDAVVALADGRLGLLYNALQPKP